MDNRSVKTQGVELLVSQIFRERRDDNKWVSEVRLSIDEIRHQPTRCLLTVKANKTCPQNIFIFLPKTLKKNIPLSAQQIDHEVK